MEQKKMLSAIGKGEEGAVEEMAHRYLAVMASNYERQEQQLLQQLYDKAKMLKQQLVIFKREVSQQNLEKLIAERRREKQRERQKLQTCWRECNESFKALQQQQKRLTNQQKENTFDVTNLKRKIEQFDAHILVARSRIAALQAGSNGRFMTETKENYRSPYRKAVNSSQVGGSNEQKGRNGEQICRGREREQKVLAETQELFFTSKYSLNKSQQMDSGRFVNTLNFTENSKLGATSGIGKKRSELGEGNLKIFLDNPQVRLKLFKLIKKQL